MLQVERVSKFLWASWNASREFPITIALRALSRKSYVVSKFGTRRSPKPNLIDLGRLMSLSIKARRGFETCGPAYIPNRTFGTPQPQTYPIPEWSANHGETKALLQPPRRWPGQPGSQPGSRDLVDLPVHLNLSPPRTRKSHCQLVWVYTPRREDILNVLTVWSDEANRGSVLRLYIPYVISNKIFILSKYCILINKYFFCVWRDWLVWFERPLEC